MFESLIVRYKIVFRPDSWLRNSDVSTTLNRYRWRFNGPIMQWKVIYEILNQVGCKRCSLVVFERIGSQWSLI